MQVAIATVVATSDDVEYVVEAERVGVSSVWVPETWGQDALTPLAYLAARTSAIRLGTGIVQLGSRSPALLAMSAMSMQRLSGGRFLLGVGASGPQVMEGWHGVPFRSPVAMARETIEMVRRVARGDRLVHAGEVYRVPLPDGRGRGLRSSMPPVAIPMYVAALGPRNLELTGELADGWIGSVFIPEQAGAFLCHLEAGAARARRPLADIDLVIPVAVELTEDVEEAARRHARGYAFTLGAMGSGSTNFYLAALDRQGYGDDARAVQSLWLAGRRDEAADRVPIELGLRTNLLGTPAMVKERLRLYRDAGITTLQAKIDGDLRHRVDTVAALVGLVDEVNREATTATPELQESAP
jgi:F420-dependent oxidoreductase-like protein